MAQQPPAPLADSSARPAARPWAELSIAQLHLRRGTYKKLTDAGVVTFGEFAATGEANFRGIPGMYAYHTTAAAEALSALSRSIKDDGTFDIVEYCRQRKIELLPAKHSPKPSPAVTMKGLPPLIKEILTRSGDERRWLVVQRRFGFEGASELTLEELGAAFGLTRQRVQQMEEGALEELKEALVDRQYTAKDYRVREDIISTVQTVYQFISTGTISAIRESELLTLVGGTFGIAPEEMKPSLFLICSLVGARRIAFHGTELDPVWGKLGRPERALLEKAIRRLDELLTRETPLPLSEFDILVRLNKGTGKAEKLSPSQLHDLIELCSSTERREDGLVWGRFECLKGRGNQVERLMAVSGGPMSLTEIVREVNARLVPLGERAVQPNNLSGQMTLDERFVPVGRSGQWGLRLWPHLETGSILQLMEQCLIARNEPATEGEIYAYVKQRRPVSDKSIAIYLAGNKDKFVKVDAFRWSLASWPEARSRAPWGKAWVAKFVEGVFKEHKTKELDYNIIKQRLMAATGMSARQVRGVLAWNPVIKTRTGAMWGKRHAVFQQDYEDKLKVVGKRPTRKGETLQQRVGNSVRRILEAQPGKQMVLAELIASLRKEHDCPKPTLYTYISNLEEVEKIELPGWPRTKLCRLRQGQDELQFPQVAEIVTDELRQKIERTLLFLNEDYIDIGLFLLSKEFESALKHYLVAAMGKGRLRVVPVNSPDKWKLQDMINYAKQNEIITDSATLNYLRQERNNRAHGTMPPLEERKLMVENVRSLAGLYIGYIKILDDLQHGLAS